MEEIFEKYRGIISSNEIIFLLFFAKLKKKVITDLATRWTAGKYAEKKAFFEELNDFQHPTQRNFNYVK